MKSNNSEKAPSLSNFYGNPRAAAFCSYLFIVLCLAANVYFFCRSGGIPLGFSEDFTASDATDLLMSPMGVSVALDAIILALFLVFVRPYGFLRFKAFACAGAFLYISYSHGSANWTEFSAWIALGLLTIRLPFALTLPLGIAALALELFNAGAF